MARRGRTTIVVTDSGLGGLAVVADLVGRLAARTDRAARPEVEVVFHDAFPVDRVGYNRIGSEEDRARTFDGILAAIEEEHAPDLLAIPCNTLSAIYPATTHARGPTRAVDIVPCGRRLLCEFRAAHPRLPLVLLATPVTLAGGVYDLPGPGVHPLPGGDLATLLEAEEGEEAVVERIRKVVAALTRLPLAGRELALFLGCTHYGYAREFLRRELGAAGLEVVAFLEPNRALAEELARAVAPPGPAEAAAPSASPPTTTVRIGWLTGIAPGQRRALAGRLCDPTGKVREALLAYRE